MPKRRKNGNKFTTISVSWKDKEALRRFAKFKKETKNGKLYESDAEIFTRLILEYKMNHNYIEKMEPHPTYPTIHQGKPQQD